MAKHISEGRAFPVFIYGDRYMLAVQAWLAAPLFAIALLWDRFDWRSSRLLRPRSFSWRLGPLRVPRGGARVRSLQKSKTFWKVLSEHGVFASVLRVPITFPAERIDGVMISGMCVPDLRGTQGSFTYFTTSADTFPGTTAE